MARTGRHLPRRVILSHGRYFYKTRIDGRQRLLPLTRLDEGDAALFEALANLYKPTARTVRELIESYLLHGTADLKPRTVHTNTIEGYFSVFKRGMKGVYQHCSEAHLQRYLTEFDFR